MRRLTACPINESSVTRREFLALSSLAVTGTAVHRHGAQAPGVIVPARSTRTVQSFVSSLMDPEELRRLAVAAIDAATAAGADYADIRLGDQREFSTVGLPNQDNWLSLAYGFGMRVRVGGAEIFVSGADPTREGLVRAAQAAAATARGLAAVAKPPSGFTRTPVVTGEWATPVEIDPFAVSPDDHCFAVGGIGSDHGQGRGGAPWVEVYIVWTAETRVFASSEGSLVTQRFTRCRPQVGVQGATWRVGWYGYRLPMFVPCSAGFEYLLRPGLHDEMHAAALELEELSRIPVGTTDVGRKEVVFDGYAHAAIIGTALLPALSLNRVLGEDQDAAGTSILAPVSATLGHAFGSSLLNFGVVHDMPYYGAAKWDDEGVATTASQLITDGTIVGYLGTRFTRQTLFQSAQDPSAVGVASTFHAMAPHSGTATALDVRRAVSGVPASTAVAASATGSSITALVREIRDGFFLREATLVLTDQQCASGTIVPNMLFEVRKGQIRRRITNAHVVFSTKKLWMGLTAVGDASTLRTTSINEMVGPPPWQRLARAVTAPAAHFHEADIVSSTGGHT